MDFGSRGVRTLKASRHLLSLLENDEITYDLLWALFMPNSMPYTTCFGTDKPRCVIYDAGEEQETSSGLQLRRPGVWESIDQSCHREIPWEKAHQHLKCASDFIELL